MVESHQTDAWNHTASVMAHMANVNSGKGARLSQPADWHPLAQRKRSSSRLTAATIASAVCPGQDAVNIPPQPG